MKSTVIGAASLVLAAAAGAALLMIVPRHDPSVPVLRAAGDRPALKLLTALPLYFGDHFGLPQGSPALLRLRTRYAVEVINTSEARALGSGGLLLAAQPQAQTAANLVALDRWVRAGGRLLLLADPILEWPSQAPLGSPLRPPYAFADTGLLAHWGLRLDAPDRAGAAQRTIGGQRVETLAPGTLAAIAGGTARCRVEQPGIVAACRIGRGVAIIVADADFIDPSGRSTAGAGLDAMMVELARLER